MLNTTTQEVDNEKQVNVLWTGGWDSTFRLIQLAVAGAVIQPYYVLDPNRRSALKEIKQMYEIRSDLSLKYKDCVIKDINLIVLGTIEIDDKYLEAYKNLKKDRFLGDQYVFLAALSERVEDLELGIHKDDKAEYFVRKLVNKEKGSDSDEFTIFGRLKYPLLDYTKLSMEKEAEASNDLDILYKSWFCFTPINDTPCGLCSPCRYSISEGMGKRFTIRGKVYNKAPALFGRMRKLGNKFV